MTWKEGQFDIVELMHFKTFSINLNAWHVNGMIQSGKLLNMRDY